MPSLGSTPGGDSILITSAPKSANWRTQVGPGAHSARGRGSGGGQSAEEAEILGMGMILNRSRPEYRAAPGVPLQVTINRGGISMKKLLLVAAAALLASCSTYKDNAPSWMPGSGAIKREPHRRRGSAAGQRAGHRAAAPSASRDDGTVSGSVTTKGVARHHGAHPPGRQGHQRPGHRSPHQERRHLHRAGRRAS